MKLLCTNIQSDSIIGRKCGTADLNLKIYRPKTKLLLFNDLFTNEKYDYI